LKNNLISIIDVTNVNLGNIDVILKTLGNFEKEEHLQMSY
jgi:hypothetical protein